MKVCLIADALEPMTGWGRYAGEIARRLIASGVDCRLVSPLDHCAYPDLAAHPDHRDLRSFMYGDRHWAKLLARTLPTLYRATAGCDLVHCFVEPYLPALALLPRRTPLVASLVGTYSLPSNHPRPARILMERAYRRACGFMSISAYTARRVAAEFPVTNVHVVPLGVDDAQFRPPRALPHRQEKLLLTVGMVKHRKGLHISIEAFARVLEKHPTARYIIAGQLERSPYVDQLHAQIQQLGIGHAVEIRGEISEDEKIELYHRCSVFVAHFLSSATSFDGFGLVYLEANACGRPAIGTRDSGAEEPIHSGRNGLLVPQGDVAATATAIDRLFSDSEFARKLGTGGRLRAQELSWENTADRVLNLYESVLSDRKEPAQGLTP